jgi:hypothetical protein
MSEFKKLDQMQDERSKSYSRFEEYGDNFIDVMISGIPALENTWVSANQILEASDEEKSVFQEKGGNRIFTETEYSPAYTTSSAMPTYCQHFTTPHPTKSIHNNTSQKQS